LQPPPLSPPPVLTTPSSTASTSSCASPSKPTSLRQRRTGLTTVLETTGKTLSGRISIAKEPYSLHLPADRNPLHRRMSEGAPIFAQFKQQQQLQHHQPSCMTTGPLPPTPSLPSSTDQSPCEIKALQEEYMQLSKETRLSQDSGHSSSGYHSPQFLRPPSPPISVTPSLSRRCSESNGSSGIGAITGGGVEGDDSQQEQENEEALSALYDDMYASHDLKNRRFSFPNSPSHHPLRERHSLTHHLQQLCLQQRLLDVSPSDSRIKGSITQGVPSLTATTPVTTPLTNTPVSTPKRERTGGLPCPAEPKVLLAQSFSLDDSRNPAMNLIHPVRSEESIQMSADGLECSLAAHHPAICVTTDLGDQFKVIFNEPMDQNE